jgi:hypothetical protein
LKTLKSSVLPVDRQLLASFFRLLRKISVRSAAGYSQYNDDGIIKTNSMNSLIVSGVESAIQSAEFEKGLPSGRFGPEHLFRCEGKHAFLAGFTTIILICVLMVFVSPRWILAALVACILLKCAVDTLIGLLQLVLGILCGLVGAALIATASLLELVETICARNRRT